MMNCEIVRILVYFDIFEIGDCYVDYFELELVEEVDKVYFVMYLLFIDGEWLSF